jgi:predicted nucleic acid-binding Zn ribbon protein
MTETPSQNTEVEEIAADRRREFRLVPQGLLALAIVVVVVIVREMFLR